MIQYLRVWLCPLLYWQMVTVPLPSPPRLVPARPTAVLPLTLLVAVAVAVAVLSVLLSPLVPGRGLDSFSISCRGINYLRVEGWERRRNALAPYRLEITGPQHPFTGRH